MKIKMFLSAVLCILFVGLNAQVNENATKQKQQNREIKSPVGTYDRNDNGISPEKKAKFKSINQQYRKDMEAVKASDMTQEAKKEKINLLQEQKRAEINNILTPEEREKLQQDKAKHNKAKKSKAKHHKGTNKFKDINLDDNQKKAIREIEKNYKNQLKQIRQNTALSPNEKKERLMAERTNRKNQIKQHLNEDQIKKMEEKSRSKRSNK